MPPEQLPWDRRDFRKHDRSAPDARFAGGGGGGFSGAGPHRWREQNRHPHALSPHPQLYRHHHNQPMKQRWYSDFRSTRPIHPGRGKQGGWHMYPEEAGHGFPPFGSRYGDRNLEDDNFRPFRSRGDGRYLRNSRENRGPFSQKDWRSPSWEPPVASSSSPGRPDPEFNNQQSIENPLTCLNNGSKGNNFEDTQPCLNNNNKGIASEDTQTCHYDRSIENSSDHTLPNSLSGPSQSVMKEKNEKDGDTADELASSDQKPDKEKVPGTTEWKLKWNRSGSMSSRGSGFSRSSSSKSMGVDSNEKVVEVQQKKPTPVNSPAAVCVEPKATAPSPSDDTSSRKKPRLGWGEGLAKYEKKKVDDPEDAVAKDGLVSSVSTTETMQQPPFLNLLDKSPKFADVLDCVSPATPHLVACSSSPSGIDKKDSIKAFNVDHDGINLSSSPSIMPQTHCEGLTFNLENLDLASIVNLSSSINEMVQSNDPSSVETGYVQTTSMNKLLVWKVDVLKALEVTETEIDSLDTELKLLKSEPRSRSTHLAASSLIPGECHAKSCEKATASSTVRPAPLQVVASGDVVENMPGVIEDEDKTLKDEDTDSPESAVSKLIESLPSAEGTFNSGTTESFEGLNNSSNSGSSEDDLGDEDKIYTVDNHTSRVITCQDISSVGSMHLNAGYMYDTILASNKESAHRSLEELNNLLPAHHCRFDMLDAQNVSSVQRDSLVIKERFLMRKRSLFFKEKVITLKFKVFQHFWREGRIVSVSRLRGKSHKKLDLYHTAYKKNRSSSRSRISYSAGSSRKVPAEEVIEYVNGLLAESPFKPCRSTLKMPALILDKEIKMSRFISNNALVEDPCAAEKGRSMINPWTAEETEIFIDNLSIFGKNFSKIASFLEHKTIADCIEFYYKNHKSESFQRAKPGVTKKAKPQSTTYLVANSKRWNREANAASLDILGEASAIVANVNDGVETQQKCTPMIISAPSSSQKAPRGNYGPPLERSNSLDNEAVAADVLAGICGSLSSEAMSSCITSSVDPTDVYHQDWKCQRVTSGVRWPLTPDVTQSVDDECSDESCGEMDPTDWTDEEKSFFIQAVTSYGKDFAMISQCLRTKSIEQCKIFFSKARKCLGLYRVLPGTCNGGVSGDVNGGGAGSDTTEDACVVQTGGSVTCNDDSECKIEVDLPPPEADIAGTSDLKSRIKSCVEMDSQPSSLDSVAAEPVSRNSAMDAHKPDVKPLVGSINVESMRVEDGDERCQEPTLPSDNNDNKALVEGHRQEDNEGQQGLIILPEDNLERKKVLDGGVTHSAEELMVVSCMDIETNDQLAGNVTHPYIGFQPSLKKESVSQNLSSEQNGCHIASVDSSPMLFSVPIKYQRHPSTDGQSDIGANGIGVKHRQKVVRTGNGDSQQHLSAYPLLDSVEPSQILKGYPVSVQTANEMNGDFNCVKHVPLQSVSKLDGMLNSDLSLRKCSTGLRNWSENVPFTSQESIKDPSQPDVVDKSQPSRKCSTGLRNWSENVPFTSQESIKDLSQPDVVDKSQPSRKCSTGLRNWSENVPFTSQESIKDPSQPDAVDKSQPSRNGDVKLFGKILISSQKNTDSCDRDDNNYNGQRHQSGHLQLMNLKFSGHQKVNLDSFQSQVDFSNYRASEKNINNIPFKSFGCWDENRTKASIFPLPDSTLLLAKYPAAFSNHHSTSTVKMDEQPFRGIIRSNGHHPLTGVSVFPNRDTSNDIADYQLLRSRERQPFAVDMNQSQEVLFSEMQRRNGSGVIPGVQSMVGIDVVRRGVLAAGGQCPGVSDPVTAINMHNANAHNVIVKANGNIIREDDMWRSRNGDVGR